MKKKRLLIALIMLLLLSTYSIQDHSFFSSKFNIKKIIIQNNLIIENEIVEKKLSYLYDENILFLDRKNLEIHQGSQSDKEFIEEKALVNIGDRVFTSGDGDVFPSDILIGNIFVDIKKILRVRCF